jgi:hypothetical protein
MDLEKSPDIEASALPSLNALPPLKETSAPLTRFQRFSRFLRTWGVETQGCVFSSHDIGARELLTLLSVQDRAYRARAANRRAHVSDVLPLVFDKPLRPGVRSLLIFLVFKRIETDGLHVVSARA